MTYCTVTQILLKVCVQESVVTTDSDIRMLPSIHFFKLIELCLSILSILNETKV